MAYWMDLANTEFSAHIVDALQDMWGNVGFVSYCVNKETGPSHSYMMVL